MLSNSAPSATPRSSPWHCQSRPVRVAPHRRAPRPRRQQGVDDWRAPRPVTRYAVRIRRLRPLLQTEETMDDRDDAPPAGWADLPSATETSRHVRPDGTEWLVHFDRALWVEMGGERGYI